MKKTVPLILMGAAGLVAMPLASATPGDAMFVPGTTHLAVDAGVALGGDKLATVTFTDGSTTSLYAGNALFGDVGFLHDFAGSELSLMGTVGYAFTAVHASNADFTFDRIPVDLIGIYSHGQHHFGLGMTYHMSPHLDLSGFAPNADFDNATGYILQYQYWLFGVRYTNIRYTDSSACLAHCSFDGSSLGVFFNYAF